MAESKSTDSKCELDPAVQEKLEVLHENFKLASKLGYTSGIAGAMDGLGSSSSNKYQGATFLAIVATKPMESPSDFGDREFASIDVCVLWPLSDGVATAPYQYKRGSKLDPKTLQAMNKTGQPLTMWADTNNSIMRFHTWTKSGFNRGPRDPLSWEFSGDGATLTMFVEPKDLEETVAQDSGKTMPIPFYMDGKKPANPIMDMDLVRICLMPKSKEALNKPKKTCFAFKGIGPCTRTPASYLPRLKSILPKTLAEATERAEKTIRDSKVQWAHQLSMSSAGSDGDFSSCEARTVTFLESNIGGQTTFMYESLVSTGISSTTTGGSPGSMVRMCIKSSNGFSTYHVDMPEHNVLRYTNSNTLDDAVGFLTLAASANALHMVVMHNTYWGTQTTTMSPLAGQTPFRGVPIIDAAKLLAPIINESFLSKAVADSYILDEKSERKAKVKGVDMGFKVFISPSSMSLDSTQQAEGDGEEMVACKVWADIALNTRCVQAASQKVTPASAKSHDLRLAPHGSLDMDKAHILCLYCCDKEVCTDPKSFKVIMNLDFNASPEVGFVGGGNTLAGKKHAWNSAIPSAIDESSEDEGREKKDSQRDMKKAKKADQEVCSNPSPGLEPAESVKMERVESGLPEAEAEQGEEEEED